MSRVRAMHYLNQFFAGMGGEEKTDIPMRSIEGTVGPGKPLQELLGDSVEIITTAYCGDDYFVEHHDKVLKEILKVARDKDIQMVVAGPSFMAGRFGFACVEICHTVSASMDLNCVTAMNIENIRGVARIMARFFRRHRMTS